MCDVDGADIVAVAVVVVVVVIAVAAVDGTGTYSSVVPVDVSYVIVQIDGNMLFARTHIYDGFLDSLNQFFCLFSVKYIVRHLK